MRIWGYVLLTIGILFLILFGLAQLGGGHIGVLPFVIAAVLIATGANLVRSGKGILQAEPAAAGDRANANTAPEISSAEAATIEMPMTPQVAAVIAAESARSWKIVKYLCGGFLVFFLAMGGVFAITNKTPGDARVFLAVFAAIGVGSAVLISGISWLTARRPVLRDLRGASYLRTTGPIQVVPMSGGAMLRLADRAFLMNGKAAINPLTKLDGGRVDYSPHGHVILAAWDNQGRSIYCAPGYDVGCGSS